MRALFCHDHTFHPALDGEVYSKGTFPYLVWERYLSVFDTLVVGGRSGPLADHEPTTNLSRSSGPGVSFVPIPGLGEPAGLLGRRRREAALVLTSAMRGVDAVIVRLPSEIGFLAARIAGELGKPLVTEIAGCAWDEMWHHGTWQGRLYAPVRAWRMRTAVRRSPFAVYVTDGFLQRRYPTSGATASVSNVQVVTGQSDVLERRLTRLQRSKDVVVLGLIGSLEHRWKGVQTAFAALEHVRESMPAFQFRILGPGDPEPWRREAASYGLSDRVVFCGTRSAGEPVMKWLDDVDIYLQPSLQEGLPRGLIEAMSRGCPAIGSTAGGIPELLREDCLHAPGDSRGLGRLIERAACDPDWQRAQARQNHEVAQRYDHRRLDAERTRFLAAFADHAGEIGAW